MERYQLILNGAQVVDTGLSRPEVLALALSVVDRAPEPDVVQVDIREQSTDEPRARWSRHGSGWKVVSTPEWLS